MGPTESSLPPARSRGRDFLQSASNAVASNVSGPVDLIAAGLRGVGVPVGDRPVGGSAWFERAGLTKPVPQSASSLAGETAGMVAPLAAAAKAPQIASGLLKMGENAAAPRTLNPQLGAIVYHGSPHKFDKFDSSRIGSGKGAQAYGHGLYLAESPSVATSYQRELSSGGLLNDKGEAIAQRVARIAGEDFETAYGRVHESALAKEKAKWLTQAQEGSLYKVDLPDSQIAKMLDWDKPLSQQAPGVADAVIKAAKESGDPWIAGWAKTWETYPSVTGQEVVRSMAQRMSGQNVPAFGAGTVPQASDALRKAGIPGIRYLDGVSRGAGQGTSNYVVFPGEENFLKILERNGSPVNQLFSK